MSDNCFQYSRADINGRIDEYQAQGMRKANMLGVLEDLKKLKPLLEEFYDKNIFYLDYWQDECGYHGWDWRKDDGSMKSMADITSGIEKRFLEIYALCLVGLGERM